jgi:hypothetical protein
MELIDFLIQNENVEEREVKKSAVHLVVNQEGEFSISINHGYVILHNCSIRNIVSEDNVWHHYFKIYGDAAQKRVVVSTMMDQVFRITKVKD